MIVEKIDASKKRKIRINPVNSNRVSSLGHPCERFLVLTRTDWDKKIPYDVGLQYIFDMGNEVEEIVLKELQEAGFTVIEQQKAMSYKHGITGHIDGLIEINGEFYPLEIKSINPYYFETIKGVNSIIHHKKSHIRGYYSQLNLYMFLNDLPHGILLFKNKSTGQYKEIFIDIDLPHCEFLLKRAESIEKHMSNNTLPDKIEWCDSCQYCQLRHICGNTVKTDGLGIIDDGELELLLKNRNNLIQHKKDYDRIDKEIKKKISEKKCIVGDFVIDGKFIEKTVYKVPEEIKLKYSCKKKYWLPKITYLGDSNE